MSKKNPYDTITSYRKRQRYGPLMIGGAALILFSLGLLFLWMWLSGNTFATLSQLVPEPQASIPAMRPTVTLVPTRTLSPENTLAPTDQYTATAIVPFQITVEAGDTLVGYAEKYGLDPEIGILLIMSYNNWYPGRFLQLGETITIPHPDAQLFTPTPFPSDLAPGTEIIYLILPGDSLASIADQFLSTVEAIIEANDLDDPNQIEVGTFLFVPVNLVTPTVAPLVSITPALTESFTLTPTPSATP